MTATAYITRLQALACIVLAMPLGGCLSALGGPPAPPLTIVTAEAPRPVVAGECWEPDPPEPRLDERRDATAADVVRHVEARKADRRQLVRLRRVCRASLAATLGGPPPARVAAR